LIYEPFIVELKNERFHQKVEQNHVKARHYINIYIYIIFLDILKRNISLNFSSL